MHRLGLAALVMMATFGSVGTAAASSPTASAGSGATWVRDSVHALNIYLPDADSDYYINGYGTAGGARTIISGRVPDARYWSYTAYPVPTGPPVTHVHDSNIATSHGRYTVTLSANCSGISGTCLATGASGTSGVLVLRLYVPVDVATAGTGGVPLPRITYRSAAGAPVTLSQAGGTQAIANVLVALRQQHGALPAAFTKRYPPAAPVPRPVLTPRPVAVISTTIGPFANPDNVYDHVADTMTRGDLVLTAKAPTYRSDSFHAVNHLGRSSSQSPQVRYWSLCAVLKGRHTGACLRDEQVHVAQPSGHIVVIVAPTCPVAGYANCLAAGPEPLQQTISFRNLLPSRTFATLALRGAYALTATYVARPG